MKKTISNCVFTALCACVVMGFASCEKSVLDEDSPSHDETAGLSRLSIVTRGGDSEPATVKDGRIYIFDTDGKCVKVLTTTEESNSANVTLTAGTYTLCAVGSNNLSRFSLPTQTAATTGSVISLQEGQTMDEIFTKTLSVTLEAGKDKNENITLERKVTGIREIHVKDVPTEVTGVSVTIAPFYSGMHLDGTFTDIATQDFTTTLTQQEDGTTWKTTSEQLVFPSAGTPTIYLTFTTENGTNMYSSTLSSALNPNIHYTFSGSYAITSAKFTATLMAENWGDDEIVNFDFDDTNVAYRNLTAGQFVNSYYVVSVNANNHTAVLLNKSTVDYTAPAAGSDATQAEWIEAVTTPLATLAKPAGITTGTWRLPTLAEVSIFSKDANVATFKDDGTTGSYFCMDGETIKWAYCKRTGDNYEVKSGTAKMSSIVNLRPVITIEMNE